jgi:hypothetical protein
MIERRDNEYEEKRKLSKFNRHLNNRAPAPAYLDLHRRRSSSPMDHWPKPAYSGASGMGTQTEDDFCRPVVSKELSAQ